MRPYSSAHPFFRDRSVRRRIKAYNRVKEIAKALQELNFETYIDKFDMRAFRQNHIYPDIWGYKDEADLIKDDLRNSFENLKKFYEKMAEQERAVLVSIC